MPYKATYNYQCLDQTYEIGQEYNLDGKPVICEKGFHYCNKAKDTLTHYDYNAKFKLLEIEDLNPSETICDFDKSCSNHIKIIREVTDPDELFNLLGQYATFDHRFDDYVLDKVLTCKYLNGRFYEYTYNEFGDVLTYKNSSGYSYSYTYNEARKILTYKSKDMREDMQRNEYSYENTYDKFGNILTHKDSTGDSYVCTRDEFGKELTYEGSSGYSHQYTYDEAGKVLTFINSYGCCRNYIYDESGNLTCVNSKDVR